MQPPLACEFTPDLSEIGHLLANSASAQFCSNSNSRSGTYKKNTAKEVIPGLSVA